MAIQVGEKIPNENVYAMSETGIDELSTTSIFEGKRIVLFGVPGAFTPGCSKSHLPGYVNNLDAIKAKGIDEIICMAVNDTFVMDAWSKAQNAEGIQMLADGNADFTKALGLETDVSKFGMGIRCQRFAMIIEDGIVKELAVEPGGKVTISSAESILERL